jgi:hypothetical protein
MLDEISVQKISNHSIVAMRINFSNHFCLYTANVNKFTKCPFEKISPLPTQSRPVKQQELWISNLNMYAK